MEGGKPVDILVIYTNTPPPDGDDDKGEGRLSQPALMRGVRLGGCEKIDEDEAIEDAVALAESADAVIVVGGLTPEWESEGFDRPTLKLPGRQDELIRKVARANPRTIVAIQAGSAVSMPWVSDVGALLQTWYLGNEVGNAIADVIFGNVNPSGRLPLTLPERIEDVPAYLNDHSEHGKIHYREDLFVGYKHYQARNIKPLFPFGFGLSYTEFSLSNLIISPPVFSSRRADTLAVQVDITVTNVGERTGSEVVQLYVTFPNIGLATPKLQMKGFEKAHRIPRGTSTVVTIALDKYAFSFWDETQDAWKVPAGKFEIHAGTSSDNLPLHGELELTQSMVWKGL
jgi:beta-glucosidase